MLLLIVLNLIGWALAALLLAMLLAAIRTNRQWQKLHQQTHANLVDLEHKHMVREMDQDRMKWLRDENTRLSLKCAAICAQARKMKGRGKSGVNPIHSF